MTWADVLLAAVCGHIVAVPLFRAAEYAWEALR